MDGPINIPNDGNVKQLIQSNIKQKLSEITGTKVDDVLPEYVMVMVVNQKTKAQVASDLEAFLSDQAQGFTHWLWDALHAMTSGDANGSARKAEPKKQQRSDDESDRRYNREREDRRDTHREREPSPNRSVFASVIVPANNPEKLRTSIENPAPSRLILNAVQDAVKSTANAPSRSIDMIDRELPSSSSPSYQRRDGGNREGRDGRDGRNGGGRDRGEYNNHRDNQRDNYSRDRDNRSRGDNVLDRLGPRGGGGGDNEMEDSTKRERRPIARVNRDKDRNISSRLGNPHNDNNNYNNNNDSDYTVKTTNISNNNTNNNANNVYLPDPDAPSNRKIQQPESNVTFTVTLNGVKTDDDPVTKPLRNKRRSFDPDENQEEVEEGGKKVKKEKCQYFPNCKRGDECAYFHPTQTCKSFPNCTYGDSCMFLHPSIPCKFGSKCTRQDCTFTHTFTNNTTKSTSLSVSSALPTPRTPAFNPSSSSLSFPPSGAKPCKHGFACPREGCSFYHPPVACMFGEACERPGCTFAHGKLCRSGIACTTPGCSFVHATQIKTQCKFGAGCLNTSCRFLHDNGDKAATVDTSMADADDTSSISASLPKTPPQA